MLRHVRETRLWHASRLLAGMICTAQLIITTQHAETGIERFAMFAQTTLTVKAICGADSRRLYVVM